MIHPDRRHFVRALILGFVMLASVALPVPAAQANLEGEEISAAQELVRGLSSRGLSVLRENKGDSAQHLDQLFEDVFDIQGMARFVVGRFWRASSDTEQQRFSGLFRRYTVFTFLSRLNSFDLKEIDVRGARSDEYGDIHVSSIYVNKNQPIKLQWLVRKTDAGLRIADLSVDGISLRVTQRDEFSSVIEQRGGLGGLNDLLEKKVVSLEKRAQR